MDIILLCCQNLNNKHATSNDRSTDELQRNDLALIETVYLHFPERTEENHEEPLSGYLVFQLDVIVMLTLSNFSSATRGC
jgi:hypothetical protein